MQNFYGYGNFQGDYWFVGKEEGSGKSFEEIHKRLLIWHMRGRNTLEDLREYHYAIELTECFNERAKIQNTWSKLIYILWIAHGRIPSVEDIRLYQRMKLGGSQSRHCLIELLPLPSPSTSHWLYSDYSQLHVLATRSDYYQKIAPIRAKYLQESVRQHQPKAVVFYSASKHYRQWWEQIADMAFSGGNPATGTNGKTLFVIMKHPVAHGVTNEYFQQVGQKIRTLISSSP